MFFLIDKPLEISSFDVIRILRKKMNIKKMGYLGTLDPLASGLLLIATENSTKLLSFLEGGNKTYRFCVDISQKSASLDAGTPLEPVGTSSFSPLSPEQLQARLLAETSQVPPRYSALHIAGTRAYEYARQEKDFVLPARPIQVSRVEILSLALPLISLRIEISSGGYIRSFAPRIGAWFGSSGGYIRSLRREALHLTDTTLTEADATTLESIKPSNALSFSRIFPQSIYKELSAGPLKKILQQGQALPKNIFELLDLSHTLRPNTFVCLKFSDGWSSFLQKQGDELRLIKNNIL